MSRPHPLDGLLNDMLYPAAMLVGAVRARDPEGVAALTRNLTLDQTHALLIAVACMVPDDQTAGQLVLWTHGPDATDQVAGQIVLDMLTGYSTEFLPSKPCNSCKRYRPLTAFHRGTVRNKYGRKAQCRDCVAETRRERIRGAARDTNRSATASSSDSTEGVAA